MNYIILNDEEYYKDVSLPRFKEVLKDGNRRVDGVFGTITKEILEQESSDAGRRDFFPGTEWLLRNSGVLFMVIRVPQDILYDNSGESLERCFELFNSKSFWLELGSIRIKNKENTYEYFFVAYNKNLLNFNIVFDDGVIEIEKDQVVDYICKKIKERVL